MKGWRDTLILVSVWGMDLCWLYGWVGVITQAGFGRAFSQGGAIALAGTALLLTLFLRRRSLRYYQIIGLHGLCLLLAVMAVIYALWQPQLPFYQAAWLGDFFRSSKSPFQWLQLITSLFSTLLFWGAGVRSAFIPRVPATISNHFDLGVIALILLHLLEWLLLQEGGIVITALSLPRLLFAFLALTVLAFCLARWCGRGKGDFFAGYGGIGVALGFLSLTVLLGTAVLTFFLPSLTMLAESGTAVAGSIAVPLGGLFVQLLLFFFGHGRLRQEEGRGQSSGETFSAPAAVSEPLDGWLLLLQKVVLTVSAGLMLLLILALLVLLLRQLGWWLCQRSGGTVAETSPLQRSWLLLKKIFSALASLSGRFTRRSGRSVDPVYLYLALMNWGRRSGVAPTSAETPRCYGRRLRCRFPGMSREISAIVDLHNDGVYARRPPGVGQQQEASAALHRLRSPRLWLSRLKEKLKLV